MINIQSKNGNSKFFLLTLLGMLTAFGPFVTDISPQPAFDGRIFQDNTFIGTIRFDSQYDRTDGRTNLFRPAK